MIQELTQKRAALSGRARALVSNPPWHGLALAAILILSAFLNLYDLTGEGYSNNYYSAAVKNMLTSWHNFFFVSFDAGFVSVDKPPLGFWIQAASAYVFGFHRWSLLLPQALAGILCVALLHSRQSPDGALSSGEIDQPQLQALDYGPGPVGGSQLRDDVLDVVLGRTEANYEVPSDLTVGAS